MMDELERIWKEAVMSYSIYYNICLEILRKPPKICVRIVDVKPEILAQYLSNRSLEWQHYVNYDL
jgi:hypothetical protein